MVLHHGRRGGRNVLAGRGRFHEVDGIARGEGSGVGIALFCRPVGLRITVALIGRGKVAVPIGRSAPRHEDRCEHCDDEVEWFCFHEGSAVLMGVW